MRHLMLTFCTAVLALFMFQGCSSVTRNSDPGPVLGLNNENGAAQKIVTFSVLGKGLEPESALTKGEAVIMAERAAVADGYRQLVEKIRGVYVDAFLKAGFGSVDKEMITTRTQSWIRGAKVVEIKRGEYGITEAQMELSIYFAKKKMIWWPTGLGPDLKYSGDSYSLTR